MKRHAPMPIVLLCLFTACYGEPGAGTSVDTGPSSSSDASTGTTTGDAGVTEDTADPGVEPDVTAEPDVAPEPDAVAEPDVAAEPDVTAEPGVETDPVCTPDCGGKKCGDDGCGGSCGDCVEGSWCDEAFGCSTEGSCPQCQYWDGFFCHADEDSMFTQDYWCGTDAIMRCEDGEVVSSGCGGCGCDSSDSSNVTCMWGAPECDACKCEDKECGLVCGASCGECAEGYECSDDNQCICAPDCPGADCGDDGCGGSCGTCADGSSCQAGECVADVSPGEFGAACEAHEDCASGWCVEGLDGDVCTQVCIDECPDGWECQLEASATDPTYLCLPEQAACVGDCADKACGDDGCGQSCGSCGADESCEAGVCVCVPSCGDAVCGDDGCDGSCGSCGADESCEAGLCVCVPSCGDAVCGADGCGESCGDCTDGATCEAGVCVPPSLCPPAGPFGTSVGDTLGDWTLTACDGTEYSFHDLCELRAVHIFAFAAW